MTASVTIERRFEPLFDIGRGGVAVVRAERMTLPDGSSQVVAVKRLLPLVANDPKTREMLMDEARIAALIRHPNVTQILAYGRDEEPFIAMELVLGEPVSTCVQRAKQVGEGPFEPRLAAVVMAQVCDALHVAHELTDPSNGVTVHLVHRDVSPQNILMGFDGVVRLTDFGIAKALGFGARTRTGEVKGKLPYMSPEQAMCDPLDRRSDLFAVGAVWFELLCGDRMLGDGNDMDMLRRLATESPPSLAEAWPEAPPELVALHARLVARAPQHRPASAHEVAQALWQWAGIDSEQASRMVAQRMQQLFPRRLTELQIQLAQATSAADTVRPYQDEIDRFVQQPAQLYRERRRARSMLAVGLGALAFGVLFVSLAAWPRKPTNLPTAISQPPSTMPAHAATGASSQTSPALSTSAATDSSRGATPVRSAGTRGRGATEPPPSTQTPPPAKPPVVRTDKLDEHPF